MVCLLRLSLCLLCLSLRSPRDTSSLYPNSSAHLCHEDERFAMLEFKKSLSINDLSLISRSCISLGQVPYVKTALWKAVGSDCYQWDGVTCNPLTGHVVGLDLSCAKLRGTIPINSTLFTLRHLQSLNLAFNDFFHSRISPEFGRFLHLKHLNLSNTFFTGKVPLTIGQLPQLASLDLSHFLYFELELPNLVKLEMPDFDVVIGNLTGLRELHLDYVHVNLEATTLSSLKNLSSLMALSLSGCNFFGPLPTWIWNISREIRLLENWFTGELPSMVDINLAYNQFSSQLTISHDVRSNNMTLLEYINLRGNEIRGSIPNLIFVHVSLVFLELSSNNLSGIVKLDMFCKLKNLTYLNLSHNSLSLLTKCSNAISSNVATCPRLLVLECSSCNITEFPDFLRTQEDLVVLDLSNNKIHGNIPKWAQNIGKDSLHYLDLSGNILTSSLDLLQWKNLHYINLNSNIFAGEMPFAICTLISLQVLDLSYNSLSGEISRCFKNFSDQLTMLDLKSNKFHGTLPSSIGKCSNLRTLDLNGNQLEGQLPPSLLRCQGLRVLDVGNNNFKGVFPYWLGSLSELQVLILRSNKFHGNIRTINAKHPFSMLSILDLSNNGFNSTLPSSLLHCFKAMMDSTEKRGNLQYLVESSYTDSIMLKVKGHYLKFVRILTITTTIDVSNNELEGEIPEVIGDLVSLRWLNLAHNNFIGRIPPSLASLSELESLDLSSNKLVGQIPAELASLTSLEFFNVSQNQLAGPIPQGKQFATFENNSYLGNLGLCGYPLLKKCGDDEEPSQPPPRMALDDNDSEYKDAFGWAMVKIGYGCGTAIGLVVGYYTVITRNPAWLLRFARQLKHATNQLF
ncbi:hypothetical protein Nepgr_016302 [Nepenthes gracilis]|uniref:Leucine-rich repeat-containing N-terminal plant-type domain-containing protein n=1 Tax=Nepenthes gracilis TaxID=150966 RepID=A0AAD3XS57_NEPGR|nr:hypothetical protein Nepgr_016302 [Nepenthes gracilis]